MGKKVKYLVEKSNVLNTLNTSNMTLNELRFFLVYLSKINARELSSRKVRINIKDFESLFHIELNTTLFDNQIKKIMSRVVEIKENGKKKYLTLYSCFEWNTDYPKVLEISCNDMILPYLFELKKNYTTYMIESISRLNSVSKIRLYEICKQYEKLDTIKIDLRELQEMLGCSTYPEFRYFKKNTLDVAIRDINKYTDINVSYEKILSCRRVVALKFDIVPKSKRAIEPIQKATQTLESLNNVPDVILSVYYKCEQEYTIEQLKNLWTVVEMMGVRIDLYIVSTYLNIKAKNKDIKNIYAYTLSIINSDVKSLANNSQYTNTGTSLTNSQSNSVDDEWNSIINSPDYESYLR
ncbi:MAG: replication initiation protein [Ruminococcus sp.]|nr:replication initiation protein [Ruminococcus sp.]